MAKRRRHKDDFAKLDHTGWVDFLQTYPYAELSLNGIYDALSGKFWSCAIGWEREREGHFERMCFLLRSGLSVRYVSLRNFSFPSLDDFRAFCDAVAANGAVRSVSLRNCGMTIDHLQIICSYFRDKKWRHVSALNLIGNNRLACVRVWRKDEEWDSDEDGEYAEYEEVFDEFYAALTCLATQRPLHDLRMRIFVCRDAQSAHKVMCAEVKILEAVAKSRKSTFIAPIVSHHSYVSVAGVCHPVFWQVPRSKRVEDLLRRILANERLVNVDLPVAHGSYDDLVLECARTHPRLENVTFYSISPKVNAFLRRYPPEHRRDALARQTFEFWAKRFCHAF